MDCRLRWGQWRVYYVTAEEITAYLPAAWTDLGSADLFMEQSQGRAIARTADLLQLSELIAEIRSRAVKEITPNV
jgi:uncharacterized protein DUF5372